MAVVRLNDTVESQAIRVKSGNAKSGSCAVSRRAEPIDNVPCILDLQDVRAIEEIIIKVRNQSIRIKWRSI